MAVILPPVPPGQDISSFAWKDWFTKIQAIFNGAATNVFPWDSIDFTVSDLADITTRSHTDLQNLNSTDYTHLTAAQALDLTDGGDSTLHYHASDRALANATGTLAVTNGGTSLATLTAHALYVGNGTSAPVALTVGTNNQFLKGSTGADPAFGTATLASADFANQGTTTTVLHGNASGNPSFSAVSLTADVSGLLPVANGGTAVATAVTKTFFAGPTSGADAAPAFRVLATADLPAGTGTVTSVAETVSVATAPSANLSVSGSPITTSGTLALSISPWFVNKSSVNTGETLTIASGYEFMSASGFTNSGTILNSGKHMVI